MPSIRVVREPLPKQLRFLRLKLKDVHQTLKGFYIETPALYVDYDLDTTVTTPKEFSNSFIEEILITETCFKELALALKESIEVKDDCSKFMEKSLLISASLEEMVNKEFSRDFIESVDVQALISKEIQKPLQENIKILEMYLRHAGAVISDIAIYPNVLNETDFDVAETPIGWGRFKNMLTGDYIYQKALCSYLMQASNLDSDRPNTREYVHKVDVPDTYETGEIVFTSEDNPIVYRFKRPFHIVPEVNYSLKSVDNVSDLSQIFILPIEVTTEYLKVALKKQDSFVQGVISFAARGY